MLFPAGVVLAPVAKQHRRRSIGKAGIRRIGISDLALPLRIQKILPGLWTARGIDRLRVLVDGHDLQIGTDPQIVRVAVFRRHGVTALHGIRLKKLAVLLQQRRTDTPDDIALRICRLRGNATKEYARSGGDDVDGDARLLLEPVGDELVNRVVIGRIKDDLRIGGGCRRASDHHCQQQRRDT